MAEPGLRDRRLANERGFLEMLLALNPSRLAPAGEWRRAEGADEIRVRLLRTPSYDLAGGTVDQHVVRIVFPEYFPSTPIEAWLDVPVCHPNVHPVNGFICLWDRHSSGDTIVEALLQVQRVITWALRNDSPEHVMQPEAGVLAPLPYVPLAVPEAYYLEKTYVRPRGPETRRRLSALEE